MSVLANALETALKGCDKRLSFYQFDGLEESLSFAEFWEQVAATAQSLKGLGVGPGVVVAVLGPTCRSMVTCCTAVWTLGATLTVLPTPTRMSQIEIYFAQTLSKIERAQVGLLVGEPSMVEGFAQMTEVPCLGWDQLSSGCGELARLSEEAPALVQFSSGTTSEPKPIKLSAEALLANSRAVLEKFPGGAHQHSCVSWLPLYHDMGLIGCFLMPLLAPGHLTLLPPEVFAARPLTWLQAISEQRATTSSAPNFAFAWCCDRIPEAERRELDLSCWRIAMVGAEKVRPQTLGRFAKTYAEQGFQDKAFSPVYGLAEATLAVTFSPLGEGLKESRFDLAALAREGRAEPGEHPSVSLGQPVGDLQVEVRDEAGRSLGEQLLGQVWVKGSSVMSGLLGQPGSEPSDGWLNTGDLGFWHEGDLHLYGRRRDILLLDGRNHDPGVLEAAAEALEETRRCCAFTVEQEDNDQAVLLCEVGKSWQGEVAPLCDRIRTVCRKQAGLTPHQVYLLRSGELPVTSSGKLRRAEAARMFGGGEFELLQASGVR